MNQVILKKYTGHIKSLLYYDDTDRFGIYQAYLSSHEGTARICHIGDPLLPGEYVSLKASEGITTADLLDLQASEIFSRPPVVLDHMKPYLIALTGIPDAAAEHLIHQYTSGLWDIIENHPGRLIEHGDVDEPTAQIVVKKWRERFDHDEISDKLDLHGIKEEILARFSIYLGGPVAARKLIDRDPYLLYLFCPELRFSSVKQLADTMGVADYGIEQYRALVMRCIRIRNAKGHLYHPQAELIKYLDQLFRVKPNPADPDLSKTLSSFPSALISEVNGAWILREHYDLIERFREASSAFGDASEGFDLFPEKNTLKEHLATASPDLMLELDSLYDFAIDLESRHTLIHYPACAQDTALLYQFLASYLGAIAAFDITIACPHQRRVDELCSRIPAVKDHVRCVPVSELTEHYIEGFDHRVKAPQFYGELLIIDQLHLQDLGNMAALLEATPAPVRRILSLPLDQPLMALNEGLSGEITALSHKEPPVSPDHLKEDMTSPSGVAFRYRHTEAPLATAIEIINTFDKSSIVVDLLCDSSSEFDAMAVELIAVTGLSDSQICHPTQWSGEWADQRLVISTRDVARSFSYHYLLQHTLKRIEWISSTSSVRLVKRDQTPLLQLTGQSDG